MSASVRIQLAFNFLVFMFVRGLKIRLKITLWRLMFCKDLAGLTTMSVGI